MYFNVELHQCSVIRLVGEGALEDGLTWMETQRKILQEIQNPAGGQWSVPKPTGS